MRTILCALTMLLVLPALPAAQATLTGTWKGQTPSGAPVTLSLTAKGASLAGTMRVNENNAAIEAGKVSKDTFTFTVTMDGGTETFAGEASKDEMKIWMENRGPSSAIVLKRDRPQK